MFKNKDKKPKYFEIPVSRAQVAAPVIPLSPEICPSCRGRVVNEPDWESMKVCPHCGHHEPLSAWQRINLLVDAGSFTEFNEDLVGRDWLGFPGYQDKLQIARQKTGLSEAVVTGTCSIDGENTVLAVMDSRFMMASMGSAVGEKLVQAARLAKSKRLPLAVFAASGGARMQEGIFALMQMARTSAAVTELHEASLLFLVVLTHPTTGGVMASFASLADIIIAEKNAQIGFTGPRVIAKTTGQKLPDGFQQADMLLQQGMIDLVLDRREIRDHVAWLLRMHQEVGS